MKKYYWNNDSWSKKNSSYNTFYDHSARTYEASTKAQIQDMKDLATAIKATGHYFNEWDSYYYGWGYFFGVTLKASEIKQVEEYKFIITNYLFHDVYPSK